MSDAPKIEPLGCDEWDFLRDDDSAPRVDLADALAAALREVDAKLEKAGFTTYHPPHRRRACRMGGPQMTDISKEAVDTLTGNLRSRNFRSDLGDAADMLDALRAALDEAEAALKTVLDRESAAYVRHDAVLAKAEAERDALQSSHTWEPSHD